MRWKDTELATIGLKLRVRLTPWWNTRLHLASALASDFTEIRQFVLLDTEGRFLTSASPAEIRRTLTKPMPKLEIVYLQSLEEASSSLGDKLNRIVSFYPTAIVNVFSQAEDVVKQMVSPAYLRELGIKQQAEVLEEFAVGRQSPLISDILRRHSPYLVLMRAGQLEGVIDRLELAVRFASTFV
jgi:hypothetical protein